jgi:hypothetical protein
VAPGWWLSDHGWRTWDDDELGLSGRGARDDLDREAVPVGLTRVQEDGIAAEHGEHLVDAHELVRVVPDPQERPGMLTDLSRGSRGEASKVDENTGSGAQGKGGGNHHSYEPDGQNGAAYPAGAPHTSLLSVWGAVAKAADREAGGKGPRRRRCAECHD